MAADERGERGRPHPMLSHEFLEALEVAALLLRHVANDAASRRFSEHGKLTLVDADGAVLAGVVNPVACKVQRAKNEPTMNTLKCAKLISSMMP